MNNLDKYNEFIHTFQVERDFFKCHEILEDIWVDETLYQTRKHMAINLLLISVGLLHWKRGNFNGAHKVLQDSLNNYDHFSQDILNLGIDSSLLKSKVQETLINIEEKKQYQDFFLPLL